MLKWLKYIGMAGGAAILLFVGYLVYGVLEWAFNDGEYYRGRYLLTATVEVDGELKSGSSVYEVSYNYKKRGSPGGGSPINGARGTMPVIDLGEHGILALSFSDGTPYYPTGWSRRGDCEMVTPARLPTKLIAKIFPNSKDFRELLNKLIDHEGSLETVTLSPNVTVRNNKKLGKNVTTAFCHLDGVVDKAIRPVSIKIEKTDLLIDTKNPYLGTPKPHGYWQGRFIP